MGSDLWMDTMQDAEPIMADQPIWSTIKEEKQMKKSSGWQFEDANTLPTWYFLGLFLRSVNFPVLSMGWKIAPGHRPLSIFEKFMKKQALVSKWKPVGFQMETGVSFFHIY